YWAYKHPTPDDFFRTIENETGENLAWFWRGWFKNNWALDQAIRSVEYEGLDPKNGAIIKIDNLQQLAIPVVIEATTESGQKIRKKLPVEIWQRNTAWRFKLKSTERWTKVVIDPDNVYPDMDPYNNIWPKNSRNIRMHNLFLAILFALGLSLSVKAQEIKGIVHELESSQRLSGVTVKNLRTGQATQTDADGNFLISGNINDYISFTQPGYEV